MLPSLPWIYPRSARKSLQRPEPSPTAWKTIFSYLPRSPPLRFSLSGTRIILRYSRRHANIWKLRFNNFQRSQSFYSLARGENLEKVEGVLAPLEQS